jgi:hypothetical protein
LTSWDQMRNQRFVKLSTVAHNCNISYSGGKSGSVRLMVWGRLQVEVQDAVWKITEAKMAGGMTQETKFSLREHKAWAQTPLLPLQK